MPPTIKVNDVPIPSTQVSWQTIFFILVSLAACTASQPSGRVLHFPSRDSIFLRTVPIICAVEAIALLSWIAVAYMHQDMDFHDVLDALLSIRFDDGNAPPTTRRAMLFRCTWFLFGGLLPVVKLCSFVGVPWSKCWGLMFAVVFVVNEWFIYSWRDRGEGGVCVLEGIIVHGDGIELENMSPGSAARESRVPESTAPGNTVSGNTTPGSTASGNTAPEGTASGSIDSRSAAPENITPESTEPGRTAVQASAAPESTIADSSEAERTALKQSITEKLRIFWFLAVTLQILLLSFSIFSIIDDVTLHKSHHHIYDDHAYNSFITYFSGILYTIAYDGFLVARPSIPEDGSWWYRGLKAIFRYFRLYGDTFGMFSTSLILLDQNHGALRLLRKPIIFLDIMIVLVYVYRSGPRILVYVVSKVGGDGVIEESLLLRGYFLIGLTFGLSVSWYAFAYDGSGTSIPSWTSVFG